MRGVSFIVLSALVFCSAPGAFAVTTNEQAVDELKEPLYKPFIERYVLDELKSLRMDLQGQRAELVERFANNHLQASDRVIQYTTSTINNIFYVIAAAASILALVGWSSLREIRQKLNEMVEAKISVISDDYEKRLHTLERKLKDRTERIISAQEEISRTNTLHSLWMRAGLEVTPQSRINVYDEILKISPDDIEALTYKADAVLELGEAEWALNLCDQALALKQDYAYAHYQYACASATLGQMEKAAEELEYAINLSSTYIDEARRDESLELLRQSGLIDALFSNDIDHSPVNIKTG
ncbi:MAG: tetratricopeptide repeat protein [Gammaproteobacteria bacterium]|nr:tetratricopeptide repeat protein [Gammaproteobacteria bacterium]